ncbi:hypothetical protein GCM10009727_48590 [Actinomadura napierensis]|uniref:Transglycosylase SLT domain-containing protein n=1 Tax=Actinomadura napierensis TaxID=267854 RepID=A0ABN2ZSS3_9ACTN
MKAAATACAALIALPLSLVLLLAGQQAPAVGAGSAAGAPSRLARTDIPPSYLRWYLDAAQTCPGLGWNGLAAVGKVESDHGRSTAPGIHTGQNSVGAGGPMQFLAGTWATYGVDGDHDGHTDRYNPADAIHGAAHYLCAHHAGQGGLHLYHAIWQYNHADWYVHKVLDQAAAYAAPVPAASGSGAIAVRAALHWLGTPYSWGGGGPTGPSYGIAKAPAPKGSTAPASPNTPGPKPAPNSHASPPPNTTPDPTSSAPSYAPATCCSSPPTPATQRPSTTSASTTATAR